MLFGNDFPATTSTNGNSTIPPMTILNKNGLQIVFNFEKQEKILLIHLRATNSTSSPITNFVFKAAVPKVETRIYSPIENVNDLFLSFSRQLLWIYFHQVVQQFHRTIQEIFDKRSKYPIQPKTNFACVLNSIIRRIILQ